MTTTNAPRKKLITKILLAILLAVMLTAGSLFGVYVYKNSKTPAVQPLSLEEQGALNDFLETLHPQKILTSLPYKTIPAQLNVHAQSAIVINAANGNVLFEKNADMSIPPASMTKVVAMYVVFQAIAQGLTTMDSLVSLPPESWAINAPPGSSLMFLAQGQKVTVKELLLGLSVSSGNDAAIALACHISGSVEAFCQRMNDEVVKLGLQHTHFVEPSGYSELNTTTPREFAAIARVYIQRYPEALEEFHSVKSMTYPQPHNLSPGLEKSQPPITQQASNKLLDILEGCDGLKTGFINESGYNISLTVKRNNDRFISVTMGGPGHGTIEGNKYRIADGKTLQEWAFASFTTKAAQEQVTTACRVWQGTENEVNLKEAWSENLTVPKLVDAPLSKVQRTVYLPRSLTAPIKLGAECGKVVYTLEDKVLQQVPLVAETSVAEGSRLKRLVDKAASAILKPKN